MEPARDLYKNDVDFEALALQSPEFAKLYVNAKHGTNSAKTWMLIQNRLKSNKHVDFNDPAVVR